MINIVTCQLQVGFPQLGNFINGYRQVKQVPLLEDACLLNLRVHQLFQVEIPPLAWSVFQSLEGSLEVKLLTVWTDEATGVRALSEEKRRRKNIREEKESEERRCRCTKR